MYFFFYYYFEYYSRYCAYNYLKSEQEHENWKSMMGKLPEGIIIKSDENKILYANQLILALFNIQGTQLTENLSETVMLSIIDYDKNR